MRRFITLLCVLFSLTATVHSQILTPFSQDLQKSSVIDTAQYVVTYNLKYKNHPDDRDYLNDIRKVYIGKQYIKDFSNIVFHFDSLRTEESKRGVTDLSNINGTPWPIELILTWNTKMVDLVYRMPLNIGVLKYQQESPQFKWNFMEENDTILGYACSKAIVSFAGRSYEAWYTEEVPLPVGPYKFRGLPGLILKIQDNEAQFIWEAIGFEKSNPLIRKYKYEGEKECSDTEVNKTIARIFKSPLSFISESMGGGSITIMDKNGRPEKSSNSDSYSIPYKALEYNSK